VARIAQETEIMQAPSAETGRTEAPVPADEHPSGDRRYKLLDVTMKRHQYRQDALIEVLHAAQGLFGFLEPGLMYLVAHRLKLPPSRVYGVATFYHFFTLKPKGEHTCIVCTGTACYVKGSDELLAAVGRGAHVKPGETTPDGALSLLTARCLGACGIAPAVVLDGAVHGHETADALLQTVKGWLPRGTVRST
jgi:bidirectional [NiFe] hydrogenase diaphorase subunit